MTSRPTGYVDDRGHGRRSPRSGPTEGARAPPFGNKRGRQQVPHRGFAVAEVSGTEGSNPACSSGESCKLRAARDTPSSGSSNEGSADPLASLRSEPKKAWSSLRSGAGSARLYPARQGVTRGKRLVVLLGQRTALAIAVKGARTRRRWSKLGEWLGRAVTTLMPCAGCNPG